MSSNEPVVDDDEWIIVRLKNAYILLSFSQRYNAGSCVSQVPVNRWLAIHLDQFKVEAREHCKWKKAMLIVYTCHIILLSAVFIKFK